MTKNKTQISHGIIENETICTQKKNTNFAYILYARKTEKEEKQLI